MSVSWTNYILGNKEEVFFKDAELDNGSLFLI